VSTGVAKEIIKTMGIPLALSVFVLLMQFGFDLVKPEEEGYPDVGVPKVFSGKFAESFFKVPVDVTLVSSSLLVDIFTSEKSTLSAATFGFCLFFIFLAFIIIISQECTILWTGKEKQESSNENEIETNNVTYMKNLIERAPKWVSILAFPFFAWAAKTNQEEKHNNYKTKAKKEAMAKVIEAKKLAAQLTKVAYVLAFFLLVLLFLIWLMQEFPFELLKQ